MVSGKRCLIWRYWRRIGGVAWKLALPSDTVGFASGSSVACALGVNAPSRLLTGRLAGRAGTIRLRGDRSRCKERESAASQAGFKEGENDGTVRGVDRLHRGRRASPS